MFKIFGTVGTNSMDYSEKIINTKTLYDGKILTLELSTVTLPNGNEGKREIVRHNGGVGVIPMDSDKNIYLVRQFRMPFGEHLYEIPAGKLNVDENPKECGIRELQEETGLITENLVDLGIIYPTVGYSDEKIYIYMATDFIQGKDNKDDDEFLNVEKMTLDAAYNMIETGEIRDSKTVVAILKVRELIRK